MATRVDVLFLKATLERLVDVMKIGEPTFPLSSDPDRAVKPFSTESTLPIGGLKRRPQLPRLSRPKDYAHGQRGKHEAGKTKPGVTSLPTEAPRDIYNRYVDRPA